MIKMMILASRRSGMTHEEFREYVTNVHGPLVRSVPEVAQDIRHYHYNFPLHSAFDPAFGHPVAEHLDIVTQGWFDSIEAQLANMAQPRYLEILRPDEHRFAGPGAVMHYTFEARASAPEHRLAARKVFYFRRRHPSLSREQFQKLWRTEFFDAITGNRAFPQVAQNYLQNHTLREADHPDGSASEYFDVIDEFLLRDSSCLHQFREDDLALAEVRGLEARLLDASRTRALVTETVVNIP